MTGLQIFTINDTYAEQSSFTEIDKFIQLTSS